MDSDAELDLSSPLYLIADQRLQARAFGRTLISHQPVNVLRLGASGAKLVSAWCSGSGVADIEEHRQLAHRLVVGGYAHYRVAVPSNDDASRPGLTVVIPVRDDLPGLRETVAGLNVDIATVIDRVIVVDDGSTKPIHPFDLELEDQQRRRVLVVRLDRSRGPAEARNRGLALVSSPLTAFVDAGVVIDRDGLNKLVRLTRHPGVVCTAPRIRSHPGTVATARYDQYSSALDMGDAPSVVKHDHRVGYVPSACLVVRTSAIRSVGGFDPSLRFGEDVDLIWRLEHKGLVLYSPDVAASHPPRSNIGAFARQRYSYGTSAGPLSQLHCGRLSPLSISRWLAAGLAAGTALGASRGALATAALIGLRARRLSKQMAAMDDHVVEATMLVGREVAGQLDGVLNAARRPLSPLLLIAALSGGGAVARSCRLLLSAAFARRLLQQRRHPEVSAPSALGMGVLDDVAYSAGVIVGSVRSGDVTPLVPTLRPRTSRAVDRC